MDKFMNEMVTKVKENWKVIGILAVLVLAVIFGDPTGV